MTPSKRMFVVPLLTIGVVLAACGGGSKKVTPQAYASSVCTAAKTWVQALQTETQNVLTATTDSPTKGKQLLSSLLENTITSTDRLITGLKGAGVPDVANGDQVSSALIDAFTEAKTNLEALRGDLSGLDTSDPQAFASGAQNLSTQLEAAFDKAGNALDKLNSPELERIGNNTAECKGLGQ